MKFLSTLALATAASAAPSADPQVLLNSSPLLKTIVPTTYHVPASTYTTTYQQVPLTTQYVAAGAPLVHAAPAPYFYPATTLVEKKPEETADKVEQVEVYKQEVEPMPETQKVEPITYTNLVPHIYNAPVATPLVYTQPAKVYEAKSGPVVNKVIQKREAEPVDYVQYQTGPYSSVKVPTVEKTLRAYNKVPVYTAPAVYNTAYATPVTYNTAYTGVASPYVYNYNFPYHF